MDLLSSGRPRPPEPRTRPWLSRARRLWRHRGTRAGAVVLVAAAALALLQVTVRPERLGDRAAGPDPDREPVPGPAVRPPPRADADPGPGADRRPAVRPAAGHRRPGHRVGNPGREPRPGPVLRRPQPLRAHHRAVRRRPVHRLPPPLRGGRRSRAHRLGDGDAADPRLGRARVPVVRPARADPRLLTARRPVPAGSRGLGSRPCPRSSRWESGRSPGRTSSRRPTCRGAPTPTAAQALAEFAGRACYQSWSKPNPATATNAGYLRHILEVGPPVGAGARHGHLLPHRRVPVAHPRADPAPALLVLAAVPAVRARSATRRWSSRT